MRSSSRLYQPYAHNLNSCLFALADFDVSQDPASTLGKAIMRASHLAHHTQARWFLAAAPPRHRKSSLWLEAALASYTPILVPGCPDGYGSAARLKMYACQLVQTICRAACFSGMEGNGCDVPGTQEKYKVLGYRAFKIGLHVLADILLCCRLSLSISRRISTAAIAGAESGQRQTFVGICHVKW